MALVAFTIGPNMAYVLVALSQLPQEQKVASEVAVTVAKTAIATVLVPKVARTAVDLLVPNGALTFVRFRLRMAIAAVLSATTLVVLPVLIVLVTDTRCFYYTFKPQPPVETEVPVSFCSIEDATGCEEYATDVYTSIYTPRFV